MRNLGLTWLSIVLLVTTSAAQSGGNYQITQSVVAGGGGQNSSGGTFTVDGTIGQTSVGTTASGGNYNVRGGFWTIQTMVPTATQTAVGGRVLTACGSGIRNFRVTLTAPNGAMRTVQT